MEIGIEGLSVFCIIGCYEEERRQPQEIVVDCQVAFSGFLKRDDIASTINYEEILKLVEEAAIKGQFHLIELLAETICDGMFARWPEVLQVKLKIRKPQALAGRAVPFVQIERDRE